MTDTPYRLRCANSLVVGVWESLQILNIRTLEVTYKTELPVLEQAQPNIRHIQNAARYEHGYTK